MFLAMKIRSTPYIFQKKSHTQALNLLLITQENKSHYVFIKDFNRLMYSKTKDQHKNIITGLAYKVSLKKNIKLTQKTVSIN